MAKLIKGEEMGTKDKTNMKIIVVVPSALEAVILEDRNWINRYQWNLTFEFGHQLNPPHS